MSCAVSGGRVSRRPRDSPSLTHRSQRPEGETGSKGSFSSLPKKEGLILKRSLRFSHFCVTRAASNYGVIVLPVPSVEVLCCPMSGIVGSGRPEIKRQDLNTHAQPSTCPASVSILGRGGGGRQPCFASLQHRPLYPRASPATYLFFRLTVPRTYVNSKRTGLLL